MTDIDFNPPKADVSHIVESQISSSQGFSGAGLADMRSLVSNSLNISSLPHIDLTSPVVHAGMYGAITGGILGAGTGVAGEGFCQFAKYPLGLAFSVIGGGKALSHFINAKPQYLLSAAKFGARGAAVGALVGITAYGAYELGESLITGDKT